MSSGLKFRGLAKIVSNIKDQERKYDLRLKLKALFAAGEVIAERAKELVPVRRGWLKKSIGVVQLKKNIKKGFFGVAITSRRGKAFKGWYAHIVEFGYGLQRPQPFLRPAIDEKRQEAFDQMREVLKGGI